MTYVSPVKAVILAGQRPGTDALASAFDARYKALIPIGGRPMLCHILQTLKNSDGIGHVTVLAQDHDAFTGLGEFELADSAGSIADSIAPLIEKMDGPIIITTADHVLLTPDMVRQFREEATGHDLAIAMVEKSTLLSAYPDSRRTWLKFRGGHYSGANLFWIGSDRVKPVLDIWRQVEQDRKKGRALIGAFGPFILLGVGLRLLSLRTALKLVGRRFGISITPVILPQAEACIDVDSVSDHKMVSEILEKRQSAAAAV